MNFETSELVKERFDKVKVSGKLNTKMKVLLYMAITVNGYIAGGNDDTSWTSEEDWASFRKIIKRAGNLIIGRQTYDLMVEGDELPKDGTAVVVLTRDKSLKSNVSDVTFITTSPQDALHFLEEKGFHEALVAGGGELNASFMKEGLIDEMYLDVEPVVLGKGIPVFDPADFQFNLELLGIKNLSPKTIQLHYKVKK